MAHQLEIVNGSAKMMYAKDGGVPWHGLGTEVPEAVTSEEAGKAAGLDWDIVKAPIYARANVNGKRTYVRVEGKYATMRETDGAVLGVVAEEYDTVNNREAFALVDEALAEVGVEARYTTAGSLMGGKRVFMVAVLPQEYNYGKTKFGDPDTSQHYLFLHTGHDGGTPVDVFPTSVRAVCANTVNLAFSTRMSGVLAGTTFWHKHLKEENILAHAKDRVVKALAAMREYHETMQALSDASVTQELVEEFRNVVIPPVTAHPHKQGILKDGKEWREFVPESRYDKAVENYGKKLDRWEYVKREEVESAFGLWSAATGYADHQRYHAWKKPEANLKAVMWGEAANIKERAYSFLKEAVVV